jgi:hypothetical protein
MLDPALDGRSNEEQTHLGNLWPALPANDRLTSEFEGGHVLADHANGLDTSALSQNLRGSDNFLSM